MPKKPDVPVRARFVAVFEAPHSGPGLESPAAAFQEMSFIRNREGDRAPLWEPMEHRKPLLKRLEESARGFFEESIQPYRLGFSFRQESVLWQHPAPGWARETPSLEPALHEHGSGHFFSFQLSDVEAWVFPEGIVTLVVTLEPGFEVTHENAGVAAELLVRVASDAGHFHRRFRNQRDLDSAVGRLQANEGSALFSSLCGGQVRTRNLVRSLVPDGFVQKGSLRPAIFVRTPWTGPYGPLPQEEAGSLVRMSKGLGATATLSDDLVSDALYTDGRENVTFCLTPEGAGCWVQAREEDRFFSEGNFGKSWDYKYLALFLLAVAESFSVARLERRAAAAVLKGQDLDQLLGGCALLEMVTAEGPSRVAHHNQFFARAKAVLGIEDSLQRLLEHRRRAPAASGPSRPPRRRPRERALLEDVLAATTDWFAEPPRIAYPSGWLPHNLGHGPLDTALCDRIGTNLATSPALQSSEHHAPVRPEDLATELTIHRYLVKTWFPWMPDRWWRSEGSALALHESLKTVIGDSSNHLAASGRPLSVAGAYIVLCNTVACSVGVGRSDALDGCLIEDWEHVRFPRAPLMPPQDPDAAYQSLVYLERFLDDVLQPMKGVLAASNVVEARLPEGARGRELLVRLVRQFDTDALGQGVGSMVADLLRNGHVPGLGPTASALVHLHLAMLPCRCGAGTAGAVVIRENGIKLVAGED